LGAVPTGHNNLMGDDPLDEVDTLNESNSSVDFNVNDKVKVKDTGECGTVKKIGYFNSLGNHVIYYDVKLNDGRTPMYYAKDLTNEN
jgi:hypothetical protein